MLIWKRLEGAKFKIPAISDGVMRLSAAQLAALVGGGLRPADLGFDLVELGDPLQRLGTDSPLIDNQPHCTCRYPVIQCRYCSACTSRPWSIDTNTPAATSSGHTFVFGHCRY